MAPLPRPVARRVSRSGRAGAGGGEPAGAARRATAHPARHRAAVGYRGVVSRGPQLPDPVRCRGPADHHGGIPAGRESPAGPAHQPISRELRAVTGWRAHLRTRDRPARDRLHGDHPRRPRAGPAARHQEPDRPARADRAGREAAPGRPGPGAGAQGGGAPGSPHDHRGAHHRAVARPGLDQGRVALVVLIMVTYYRLSGVLAVAALALYVVFTLAGLAGFGFTLTLPGLAGLVLSVGIAVDANVLIFERIREELQHGKLVRTAVDEGFLHAMSAIIDSNVSTALTAFILYLVGTGPVQGFAITLIIGIAASMITAIFVVRTFYMIWLDRRPDMATLSV
ncbi:MAG: hypothetical protein DMD25_12345 [Gemmatimonadetes bacterium]|nr:MAG: hypothetical protein DMD25_12345 [Gemmatimonadota bacterium]